MDIPFYQWLLQISNHAIKNCKEFNCHRQAKRERVAASGWLRRRAGCTPSRNQLQWPRGGTTDNWQVTKGVLVSVNLNKLRSLNSVACIAEMLVANWHSCEAFFFSLLKSQHVVRMADIIFSKLPVINKRIKNFEMVLISSSLLLSRIFSAKEVIYFG